MTKGESVPHLKVVVKAGSAKAFEAWRWAVSPIFDLDTPDRAQRKSYAAEVESNHLGAIWHGASKSSASVFSRSHSLIARTGTDQFLLQRYKSPSQLISVNGHDVIANAGDVAVFDLTRPVSIQGESSERTSLLIARRALESRLASADDTHGLVLRAGSPSNGHLVAQFRMIERNAHTWGLDEAPRISRETIGVIAAAIGVAQSGEESTRAAVRAALLRRMCGEIHAGLAHGRINSDLLAQRFQISRATLYRMFEPLGGVAKYIQEQRLRRAFRDLIDPELFHEQISTVAYRWGFKNHTSFGRAFRATYGMTPSDVRCQVRLRSQEFLAHGRTTAKEFATLRRWISELDSPMR